MFRIGDVMLILPPGLNSVQRNIAAPGKICTTDNVVLCNPKIADAQRADGRNPYTDLGFMFGFNYDCDYRLCDIFEGDSTFTATVNSCKGFCMGDGSSWSFAQSKAQYGPYIDPVSVIPTDTQGNSSVFNSTVMHYGLSVSLSSQQTPEGDYSTKYEIKLNRPSTEPHTITKSPLTGSSETAYAGSTTIYSVSRRLDTTGPYWGPVSGSVTNIFPGNFTIVDVRNSEGSNAYWNHGSFNININMIII